MFGLFKSDPLKKMRKDYDKILNEAMQAQRAGNIRLYSERISTADSIYQKIRALEADIN